MRLDEALTYWRQWTCEDRALVQFTMEDLYLPLMRDLDPDWPGAASAMEDPDRRFPDRPVLRWINHVFTWHVNESNSYVAGRAVHLSRWSPVLTAGLHLEHIDMYLHPTLVRLRHNLPNPHEVHLSGFGMRDAGARRVPERENPVCAMCFLQHPTGDCSIDD